MSIFGMKDNVYIANEVVGLPPGLEGQIFGTPLMNSLINDAARAKKRNWSLCSDGYAGLKADYLILSMPSKLMNTAINKLPSSFFSNIAAKLVLRGYTLVLAKYNKANDRFCVYGIYDGQQTLKSQEADQMHADLCK